MLANKNLGMTALESMRFNGFTTNAISTFFFCFGLFAWCLPYQQYVVISFMKQAQSNLTKAIKFMF